MRASVARVIEVPLQVVPGSLGNRGVTSREIAVSDALEKCINVQAGGELLNILAGCGCSVRDRMECAGGAVLLFCDCSRDPLKNQNELHSPRVILRIVRQ